MMMMMIISSGMWNHNIVLINNVLDNI